jgi:hypothetical protein
MALTMIELFYDRGNHYEFVSLAQELASGGEMRQAQSYDFTFKNVEKQYESYSGINVKLRWVELTKSHWEWCEKGVADNIGTTYE